MFGANDSQIQNVWSHACKTFVFSVEIRCFFPFFLLLTLLNLQKVQRIISLAYSCFAARPLVQAIWEECVE